MPSWNEMGAALNTLRELDVSAIREEAERPVTVACLGDRALFDRLAGLLRPQGRHRHGAAGGDPLLYRPLAAPDDDLRRADLLLILLDGRRPLPVADTAPLGRLAALAVPTVIVIAGVAPGADLGPPRPEFAHAQIVAVQGVDAASQLMIAAAILARLPGELHLAAARRLPGLRDAYSQELVSSVSFTNASFAAASSIPEQIPILAMPFVAADMIVLTKNQALMVYRLALAYGAPPDFRERMVEMGPVVGGGFFWRQMARSLIGLIPIWGVVPKVAVAYAGTYATGVAAWRWFGDSEILSRARLQELTAEAMRRGRLIADGLAEGTRAQGERARRGLGGLRLLSWRKTDPPPVEDKGPSPGV